MLTFEQSHIPTSLDKLSLFCHATENDIIIHIFFPLASFPFLIISNGGSRNISKPGQISRWLCTHWHLHYWPYAQAPLHSAYIDGWGLRRLLNKEGVDSSFGLRGEVLGVWWVDIEMPNDSVDKSSWESSACYPRHTFDPLSESPSTRDSRITMADFRLCSTSRSHSQAGKKSKLL